MDDDADWRRAASLGEKFFFYINIKNFTIHATIYYTLTTMQHYDDDTMRSKRQCLPHGQHIKIYKTVLARSPVHRQHSIAEMAAGTTRCLVPELMSC